MKRVSLRTAWFALIVTAGAMISSGRAYAHHSFAATYLEDKTQKIEGKVVQFLFQNPHSFLMVEAPDERGVLQRWSIEWGSSGHLSRQGVTHDSLKAGDRVVVIGHPGRAAEDHRLHMVSIQRPSDGWKWGAVHDEVESAAETAQR
jgi:Family of unknown function (DUF6152)